MNKTILHGNLTRDPEVKFLDDDKSVCNFAVAVNERYTDRNGELVEKPMFIDCECWGRRGEVIAEYFVKGQKILVEGKLQFDQWETDEGERRSKHKVRVDDFDFSGTKAENDKLRAEQGESGGGGNSEYDEDEENIPF